MWILVEVDKSSDVGVNEIRRFMLRMYIALIDEAKEGSSAGEYHIDEYMTEVHPVTKEVR